MRIKKFKFEFLAFSISAILTFIIYLKTDALDYKHPHFQLYWDHHKYIWMALHNLDFHIAPYCWRIFIPFIASLLPFELSINFKIISNLSVALTGFFIFKIGQKIFNDEILSITLMFAYYSISFVNKFVIYDFWLPDAFAFLLITVGIYSILLKNDFLFFIILTFGAMTKESVLFLIPTYYSFNAKKLFDLKTLKQLTILSLIPLFIFLMIRILIQPLNENPNYLSILSPQLRTVHFDESTYNFNYLITNIGIKRLEEFSIHFLYKITLYVFLIHFIFAFIDWAAIKKFVLKFLPLIFLAYLQIFFAINEERLVVVAFVPVIILSLSGQIKLLSKIPNSRIPILLSNIVFALLVITSGLFYGNWLIIRQIAVAFIIYFSFLMYEKIRKN